MVTIATENPTFDHTRIRDALSNLGHEIGRNTVKRILAAHGIEPAPERITRTPWKMFLKAHRDAIAAADLFTVEMLTLVGLVRYYVFFVMASKTRRVEIAGITCESECLSRLVLLGENHLRTAVAEYVRHYHGGDHLSEQLEEFVHGQACFSDQGAEGPFGQLPVIRDGEPALRRPTMTENDMTSRLMVHRVPEAREGANCILPGHNRQLRQSWTSTTSSVIAGGIGSACFLRLVRYAPIASWMLARASSRVRPWETHPGRAGQVETKTPSSSGSMTTRYFMCPPVHSGGTSSKVSDRPLRLSAAGTPDDWSTVSDGASILVRVGRYHSARV